MMILRLLTLFLLLTILAACDDDGLTPADRPTEASPESLRTAIVLTAIAPPAGFNEFVSFPAIDNELVVLPDWYYTMTLRFDGVFTGTTRAVDAQTTLEAWYDQIGQRRRVVIDRSGSLLTADDEEQPQLEGVRVVENTFLVSDNVCVAENTDAATDLADLRASDFIGGVARAVPIGGSERINGEDVWPYGFTVDDLVRPPALQEGNITGIDAELWIAPEHNAVIRYYVTMTVENAIIFNSSAPLDGTLTILYDLDQIGIDPNITRPFGC